MTDLLKIYRKILQEGEKEMPEVPPKLNGKRGRIAKSDAHNLCERLTQRETAVLLFSKKSDADYMAYKPWGAEVRKGHHEDVVSYETKIKT